MNEEMNTELKFTDDKVTLVVEIGEQLKSRTQSIKTIILEKDGEKFVSIQKWWRKESILPWQEGKGFHFNLADTENITATLNEALVTLKQY